MWYHPKKRSPWLFKGLVGWWNMDLCLPKTRSWWEVLNKRASGPRRQLWSQMHFPVHRLGCHQWHPRVLVGMGNLRLWHHRKTESRTPKKSRVKKKCKRRQAAKRHGLWMREDDIGWLWAVWVMIDLMQGVERVQVSNEFNRFDDACSTTNLFNILKAARPYSLRGPEWLLSLSTPSILLAWHEMHPLLKCCIPGIFQSTNTVTVHNRSRCNVICCI